MKTIDSLPKLTGRGKYEHLFQQIFSAPIGTVFMLERGVDYDVSEQSIGQTIRQAASIRGTGVSIRIREGMVYVKTKATESNRGVQ